MAAMTAAQEARAMALDTATQVLLRNTTLTLSSFHKYLFIMADTYTKYILAADHEFAAEGP